MLVYIEAHNNLYTAALNDIAEMRRSAIPADCRLLVYRSIRGEDHPTLTEVYAGADSVLVNYPAGTSAIKPEQMVRVITDMKRVAPADEYGMVLWSHSSGWRQKMPQKATRGYGMENGKLMSISTLGAALRGHGLSFIFFDTCYMGSAEVAYELRDVASWMVASVCEVPTPGMPYDKTVPRLFDKDVVRGLRDAVDITVNSYRATPSELCPSTLSLIDLTAMGQVADEVKRVISNPLPDDFQPQCYSVTTPYKYMFFDLGEYIEALGGDPAVVSKAVVHESHTDMIWGRIPIERCSGLSVFIPGIDGVYDYSAYDYSTLEWARYLDLK